MRNIQKLPASMKRITALLYMDSLAGADMCGLYNFGIVEKVILFDTIRSQVCRLNYLFVAPCMNIFEQCQLTVFSK